MRGLFVNRETRLYFCFFAAMIAGIPFSVYRPGSFDAVILKYSINMVYFFLFVAHMNSVLRLKQLAVVLLCAMLLLTSFGLVKGTFTEGRYDIGSSMYDPNDVAFVEVSLLALLVWILAASFSKLTKALALAGLIGGIILVLLTASRGGLLGLSTFLVLFLCLRVGRVSKAFKLALVAALVIAAATNAHRINLERLMTLSSIEDDYNFQAGGRMDLWKRGWTLFLAAPLTGVGVEGFAKAIGDMRAAERGEIPEWQTAHSAYVLVLTETGIIGSVPFLLLIITCVITFNRHRRHRESGEADLEGLPGLLLVGVGAQLVAAAFLSQAYSMFFTLTFAMSAALTRMTTDQAVPTPVASGARLSGRRVILRRVPQSRWAVDSPPHRQPRERDVIKGARTT
jgi:O-antigen ligase